jgi:hypothetical protein
MFDTSCEGLCLTLRVQGQHNINPCVEGLCLTLGVSFEGLGIVTPGGHDTTLHHTTWVQDLSSNHLSLGFVITGGPMSPMKVVIE